MYYIIVCTGCVRDDRKRFPFERVFSTDVRCGLQHYCNHVFVFFVVRRVLGAKKAAFVHINRILERNDFFFLFVVFTKKQNEQNYAYSL